MVCWHHLAGVAVLLMAAPSIQAGSYSFTGTFSYDTDVQFFTFTLLQPTADVTLRTWSYSGGTNAKGQTIASGGFEPYLSFYSSDGMQMNPGASGPCGFGGLAADPVTEACGDVYYPTTISFPGGVWDAGTYSVALSTFANPGLGDLSDGFFASGVLGLPGHSNFTCQVGAPGYQGNPPTVPVDQAFCDEFASGVARTGKWALDILNVDSASPVSSSSVPEPSSLALGALAFVAFTVSRLRRG